MLEPIHSLYRAYAQQGYCLHLLPLFASSFWCDLSFDTLIMGFIMSYGGKQFLLQRIQEAFTQNN